MIQLSGIPNHLALPRARGQQLEQGMRMTAEEFDRAYEQADDVRAQLIEGVVHMASPVWATHSSPHADLIALLRMYAAKRIGIRVHDNVSVQLDAENRVQPDIILLRVPPKPGGAWIRERRYVVGAPDLVAEIAGSSSGIDLGDKLEAYRRNGVREYVVWRTDDRQIDAFTLVDGHYVPIAPDDAGIVRSIVFPGLWLDIPALLADDFGRALETLERGIRTEGESGTPGGA
jgi:Uma2 family endonuclease